MQLVRHLALVVALYGLALNSAYALPDELEIRLDDTTDEGTFGVEVTSNYTISGPRLQSDEGLRPGRHLLQLSPEISYGLTDKTQIGAQLFSSMGPNGGTRTDGGRFELLGVPIRPEDNDDDGYWLGALFEIGHLPSTLSANRTDAEMKILFGLREGRWLIGASPELGSKVPATGPVSQTELEMKLKIAYRLGSGASIGIEQYNDLGTTREIGRLSQRSQQTFCVLDFQRKDWNFNVGLGRGWNDYSDRWVVKAIVEFPFGN
jgi:hypothetical protein